MGNRWASVALAAGLGLASGALAAPPQAISTAAPPPPSAAADEHVGAADDQAPTAGDPMLDAMAAEQDRAARARARQAADTAEMNALAARRKLNDERSGKTATAPAPAAVASQPTPAQAQAVLPAMIPIVTEVSGDHGRYDAVVRYQDGRRVRIRAGAILADGSKVVRITADDVTVKDASGDEHQLPQAGAVAASPVGGR